MLTSYFTIANASTVGEIPLTAAMAALLSTLSQKSVSESNPYHARLTFEKDKDKAQITENMGDGKDYGVSFVLEEEQSAQEYKTFMWLVIFTVAFGALLILFLKNL